MKGDNKMLDWEKAEKYLSECEAAYAEIGSPGYFVLNMVLRPLRDRFKKGERAVDLYDEIMGVSL